MPNPNPIGFSIQGNTGFYAKAVQANPRVVVLMDPFASVGAAQYARAHSGAFIIVRWTQGDQDYLKPANVWCEPAYAFYAPYRDAGALDAVALINEPHAQGATPQAKIDSLKRLNDWHVEAAAFFHARNIKVGAFSCSVGEFGLKSIPGNSGDEWQYLHGAAAACDYHFCHEYTWLMPPTGLDYWLLRYRKMFAELPAASRKPIVITECLHDHGLVGDLGGVFRDDGRQIYGGIQDLSWYADRLSEDNGQNGRPLVLGATVFQFGAVTPWSPTFDWGDGDERATALIDFMRTYIPTPGTPAPIPPPVDPPPVDPPPVDPPPIDPPPVTQGALTMVPFKVPQVLLDNGYQAIEGKPIKGRPFFRLMWTTQPDGVIGGASVKDGVSAFERVAVIDLFGRPATGYKLVNRFPDGNGDIVTIGSDFVGQFNNGTGSAFTPPATPPLDIFVADFEAFKDDEHPPRIHFTEIWSDHVLAGDTAGRHKENQWVLYQVPTNDTPVDFAQALRYAAYPAIRLTVPVFNPGAALQAAARARDLKAVLSDEFYIKWANVDYVCQDFAGGILYTIVGHYGPDDFKTLAW